MTLFDLDKYTEDPRPDEPEPKKQYYIVLFSKDGGVPHTIWRPHTDYDEIVSMKEIELTRKKPFRWKTRGGATRYAKQYRSHKWEVREWVE